MGLAERVRPNVSQASRHCANKERGKLDRKSGGGRGDAAVVPRALVCVRRCTGKPPGKPEAVTSKALLGKLQMRERMC